MKNLTYLAVWFGLTFTVAAADTNTAWLTRPLSLADALNTALLQNATILKAQNDLQASHGLVVQTRAVALPQLTASGQYKYTDPNDIEGFIPGSTLPNENWNTGIQISQAVYEGGKLIAAIKAADATKQQALAQYQTAVANALLTVQTAYYDVLLAEQQIAVQESSVKLLEKELEDQQHRLDAGTVPKFNVLRAEVAVANERPNLISARNNYRRRFRHRALPADAAGRDPAGAGAAHRTGGLAQTSRVAGTEHRQRQGRLQTGDQNFCGLRLEQRAVHAADGFGSRHQGLERRRGNELEYF